MEIHIGDRVAEVELVSKEDNKVVLTIDAPAPVIPFPLPVRARPAGVRAGSPGCPTHSLRRPAR